MVEIDLKKALRSYFGFDSFKGKQEEVINNVLKGHNTFVIMPTGGGKSLCYQLPALVLEGTAIVVSPLIALMKNQVDAIRNVSDNESIAHFLNSSLSKTEIARVKSDIKLGVTKLLYVAPESLTKQEYVDFLTLYSKLPWLSGKYPIQVENENQTSNIYHLLNTMKNQMRGYLYIQMKVIHFCTVKFFEFFDHLDM